MLVIVRRLGFKPAEAVCQSDDFAYDHQRRHHYPRVLSQDLQLLQSADNTLLLSGRGLGYYGHRRLRAATMGNQLLLNEPGIEDPMYTTRVLAGLA